MKGLLLKDLMMMLKYGRLTLLACLIFSLVGWLRRHAIQKLKDNILRNYRRTLPDTGRDRS